MYGNALITIVATDNNREKLTWKKPRIAAELRKKNLQELEISDTIEIGSDDNHLIWLEKYKPYVICLWYDQVGFSSALEIIPNLTIKRIASYHPGKYKSSLIK
jgi:glycerol-3-phosphate cytidylyltransferase-like family protein